MEMRKKSKRTIEALYGRNTKPHVYLLSSSEKSFLFMVGMPRQRYISHAEQSIQFWVNNTNIDRDRGIGSWIL